MAKRRQSIKGKGDDAFWSDDGQDDSIPVSQQKASKPADELPTKVKATFYLWPDDITALEELKLEHWKQAGEKTDKSQLIRQAIKLLKDQYASKPAKSQ